MANQFKGINTEGVKYAQKHIETYVKDANWYLSQIKNRSVGKAFRGNYAAAIQEFINSVVEEVRKPLDEIEAFSEKIEQAKKDYEAKDDEMRSNVGTYQA